DALEGEWIGIAGVVHSGKSTVGAVMSGLYDYEGTVKLCGVELKDIKEVCVPNFISYMSSKPELFNDTIENNIALGRSGNIDDALIGADLTRDGISKESLISRNTTNLSGGQQKRLEIARAIFSPSKLIVLDDPFNAVDVEMAKEILSELRERTQKSILVIVSCNKEILSMCDKVLFLSKSKAQYDTYPHLLNKSEEFGKLMEGDIK
ncbi:MAG: ABC transporter ATP-binding protein, partial [Clostridia bacterium]